MLALDTFLMGGEEQDSGQLALVAIQCSQSHMTPGEQRLPNTVECLAKEKSIQM